MNLEIASLALAMTINTEILSLNEYILRYEALVKLHPKLHSD